MIRPAGLLREKIVYQGIEPADIAEALALLAGPAHSINGQVISANGGPSDGGQFSVSSSASPKWIGRRWPAPEPIAVTVARTYVRNPLGDLLAGSECW